MRFTKLVLQCTLLVGLALLWSLPYPKPTSASTPTPETPAQNSVLIYLPLLMATETQTR